MSRAHLDARCRLCSRQFRSVEDLQGHYLVSPAHPHCALCEIGFPSEVECDEVRCAREEVDMALNIVTAYGGQPSSPAQTAHSTTPTQGTLPDSEYSPAQCDCEYFDYSYSDGDIE